MLVWPSLDVLTTFQSHICLNTLLPCISLIWCTTIAWKQPVMNLVIELALHIHLIIEAANPSMIGEHSPIYKILFWRISLSPAYGKCFRSFSSSSENDEYKDKINKFNSIGALLKAHDQILKKIAKIQGRSPSIEIPCLSYSTWANHSPDIFTNGNNIVHTIKCWLFQCKYFLKMAIKTFWFKNIQKLYWRLFYTPFSKTDLEEFAQEEIYI